MCHQVFWIRQSCESHNEDTNLLPGFGCSYTSLGIYRVNVGYFAIPSNHGRVALGSGQRCRTAMFVVGLPVAFSHLFSLGVEWKKT